MAIQYKAYEFRIYSLISQFDQLLEDLKDSNHYRHWKEKISQMKDDLETRRFRIAVMGEFNRGKTSFVNALLGKKILPEDYVPTTAAMNRITYSDTPDSYVIFKDGRRKQVPISNLAEYVTKLTEQSAQNAAEIEEAVVEYPSLLCRNGVDLIDTPGLNDEDAMNTVTISKLESIDLALIAVDPSMPFSMTECSFTVKLLESAQISQIVFIVTKIDMLRERERERAVRELHRRIRENVEEELLRKYSEDGEVLQKYHEIFDTLQVFPVSSLDAMDALSCGDMDAYRKSGFWELNNRLPDIVMRSQNRNTVLKPVRELKSQLGQVRQWIEKREQEQQEHLKLRLKELEQVFNKTGQNGIADVFVKACGDINKVFPMAENVASAYISSFEQALNKINCRSYDELKKAFAPVIRQLYQTFNQTFHQKEIFFLTQYQAGTLMMRGKWSCRQLDELLQPYPELHKAMQLELAELYKRFSFCDISVQREAFFWAKSPIPEYTVFGTNQDIMSHVKSALIRSIQDYQRRRNKELGQMIEDSQEKLNQQFQLCEEKLSLVIPEYLQLLHARRKKGRMSLAAKLSNLEKEISQLSDDFLSELQC